MSRRDCVDGNFVFASFAGNEDPVALLLRCKANVEAPKTRGNVYLTCIRDIEQQDTRAMTTLLFASFAGNEDPVALLLSKCGGPNDGARRRSCSRAEGQC